LAVEDLDWDAMTVKAYITNYMIYCYEI
jgi:hypothetical protein